MADPPKGCVVCGHPVSPKDGIEDRCGHHRRQLLRNRAKAEGLPPPTKPRSTPKPKPERSPLEELSPAELREAHEKGQHEDIIVIACVRCIRERGGRVDNVQMLAPRRPD